MRHGTRPCPSIWEFLSLRYIKMDKVDIGTASLLNPSLLANLKQDTKKIQSKKTSVSGRSVFSELMEASAAELGPVRDLPPSEEALAMLMDSVHNTGSDLLNRPFHDEIIKYKRAVRDFLNYIVKNGYEMEKSQGIKKRVVVRGEAEWKSTVFHHVKIIDQKLEELAAAIISGQSTQLERVSKMEIITGLLVDLTITGVIKERDD